MEKTNKWWAIILYVIFVLVFFNFSGQALEASEDTELRIEQVKINMPDIKTYYYPGNTSDSMNGIMATLNGEKLTVINQYAYNQETEGCDYYIMVDISLSIGHEYYPGIRQAILDFQKNMKTGDTITIITFGDTVSVAVDGAVAGDAIEDAVNAIDSRDYNTHLFEAIDKTTNLTDQNERVSRRAIAVVITDGEDCSTNESTKNEALEKLQKAGIPLYAMAVRETAKGLENAFVGEFSDFSRAANGCLFVFGSEEASSCLAQIKNMTDSVQVIELKAKNNRVNPVMQTLALVFPGSGSEAIQVCPRYNQPDTEPPSAIINQTAEKEITIAFSEAVLNADQASSYRITVDGGLPPLYAVHYDDETCTALLSFSEVLPDGEYRVDFTNITDDSIEENKIAEGISLVIDNITDSEVVTEAVTETPYELMLETEVPQETEPITETEPESEITHDKLGSIMSKWYFLLGLGVFLLILLVVLLLCRRKGRKKKEDSVKITDNIMHLDVRGENEERKIDIVINQKIIVGRSSSCDISFMDKLLSRQHFSIEKDDGNFYLTDLGATNGTLVNGVKIGSRCKLKNGDVIQAGTLHITITW